MRRARWLLRLLLTFVLATGLAAASGSASAEISSSAVSPVTVYGAGWCSACRTLEAGLRERKIAFEVVDVDDDPTAFARARSRSGTSGAIPLTSIVRASDTVWVVGANVEAVARACDGD